MSSGSQGSLVKENALLINSAILYSLAFVVTFFVNEISLAVTGSLMGLNPVLYHNKIAFTSLSNDTQLIAFIAGPAASLLLGTAALLISFRIKKLSGNARLFILWLYINGITLFLSQVPNLPFENSNDLGKAIGVISISPTILNLFAVLSLLLLILLGMYSIKPFLSFAVTSESISTARQRRYFIFKIGIIPWLVGAVLSFPFRVPPLGWEYLILPVSNGMVVVWTYIGARGIGLNKIDENGKISKVNYKLIFIWLFLIIIFQLVLRPGINFY